MKIDIRRCLTASMAAWAGFAAMPSRADDARDHASSGLDLNVPSRATVYGRLAMGYFKRPDGPAVKLCPQNPDREEPSVGSPARSYLGFRSSETLSGGLLAHLQLESTLQVRNGRGGDYCGRSWSGRSTVALSDRSWGRIDLGRLDQPAWAVALAADPWGDSSAASPGARLYFPPEEGATRASDSITYSSRADQPLAFALQLGRDRTGEGTELGGSVRYARGAWYAGLGWQRWADRSYAAPIAVNYDTGWIKLHTGATRGRAPMAPDDASTGYTSAFVGATMAVMAKGDPLRHEWRIGFGSFAPSGRPGDMKLGVGWRYRLSPRTAVQVSAALVRNDKGERTHGLEVGFVHAFSRDMQTPQRVFRFGDQPWIQELEHRPQ